MFPLPPAKKEFPCRMNRKRGYGECGQKLYRDKDGLVLNAENGRGGIRDERHICPDRLGSQVANDYDFKAKRWCSRCDKIFFGVFAMCPYCFKLKCTRCGKLRDWRLDVKMAGCSCLVEMHEVEPAIYPRLAALGIKEVKSGYLYSDIVEISHYVPELDRFLK
jgi:hypothetical protein